MVPESSRPGGGEAEAGQLGSMPFVGIPSFLKLPVVAADAPGWHFLILGLPYDEGASNRPGARFGPRAIRNASTLYSYEGDAELFDVELGRKILTGARIADAGDVPIVPGGGAQNREAISDAVRRIIASGAIPICLGGDHSVSAPVLRAVSDSSATPHLVHLDTHMDFDSYLPPHTHGTPIRHAVEEGLVSGVTQIGIRGLNSGYDDWLEARRRGVHVVTAGEFRTRGPAHALEPVPEEEALYLSIDIDVFDPSIAPGTGTPEPGGLGYPEVVELVRLLARRGPILGVDLVEVNPAYDHGEITAILAARLLLDVMGAVWEARSV